MRLLWLNLLMVSLVSVFSFLGCGQGKPKEEAKKCSEITDSSDCTKNTKCLWQPGSSGSNTQRGPNGNNEEERPNPNYGNDEEGDFAYEGQGRERMVDPEVSIAGKCIEKPAANNNNGGRPEGPGRPKFEGEGYQAPGREDQEYEEEPQANNQGNERKITAKNMQELVEKCKSIKRQKECEESKAGPEGGEGVNICSWSAEDGCNIDKDFYNNYLAK